MTKPVKFLFDTDFAKPVEQPTAATPETVVEEADPLLYTQADHDAARAEAYAEGEAAGIEQAKNDILQHIDTSVTALAAELAKVVERIETIRVEADRRAAELGYAVAKKLARAVSERLPADEVERLLRATLNNLNQFMRPPRLTVWVAPNLTAPIGERAAVLATQSGFSGELRVLPDPAMKAGDCRLEWGDGGAERTAAEIEAAIDEAVRRYLDSALGNDPINNPASAIGQAAAAGAAQPPVALAAIDAAPAPAGVVEP